MGRDKNVHVPSPNIKKEDQHAARIGNDDAAADDGDDDADDDDGDDDDGDDDDGVEEEEEDYAHVKKEETR